jgi:hypothetical protein
MKNTIYSPERVFQDPNYSSKLRKADVGTISQHLQSMLGVKLSDLTSGRTSLANLRSPLQQQKSGQNCSEILLMWFEATRTSLLPRCLSAMLAGLASGEIKLHE